MQRARRAVGRGCLGSAAVLLLSFPGTAVHAFNEPQAQAVSRAAVGARLGSHALRATDGRSVPLDSLRGRPLVISLIYTGCYGSCGIVTRRLAKAVEVARDALGEDSFLVLTVGFDAPADSPRRMASYARERSIGDDNWLVLSADADTAKALAGDLGFSYTPSPRGFDHVTQTTLVDASGIVYRQVYGDAFPTPALVEPLKELVYGSAAKRSTVDGWVNGLKLLCTVYDPSLDRYRFDYSVFVAAFAGVVSLGAIAVFIVKSWNAGSDRHAG